MVHVVLKASSDERRRNLAKAIHAATVRRRVVLALIEEMVARGHPAYRKVRMEEVRARAAAVGLPEEGPLPELLSACGVGRRAPGAEPDWRRPWIRVWYPGVLSGGGTW